MSGKEQDEKLGRLEEGLLQTMQAIDKQIEREMQRTPSEREAGGVQKWEPYGSRIERVSAFVLNALGNGDVQLDSLLVLAQSFVKSLQLVVDDLGQDGLGSMRSTYCQAALEAMTRDLLRVQQILHSEREALM